MKGYKAYRSQKQGDVLISLHHSLYKTFLEYAQTPLKIPIIAVKVQVNSYQGKKQLEAFKKKHSSILFSYEVSKK